MKHSLKVFFGLLFFVPFASNVYGVDYVKATNFSLLAGETSVFPTYNVDTRYKKVTVKAYKMTTYFGEYIKESEYPIWEMTATYNDAGYIASKTDEAKDQHTVFHYGYDGIADKVSIYYLSTGNLKKENYTYDSQSTSRSFWKKKYYSNSDYLGTYRFCFETSHFDGHEIQMLFNSYWNKDGIEFIVWCWGQKSNGTYFAGEGHFNASETWLRKNGFQGEWKNNSNHKKIFDYIVTHKNVSISLNSGFSCRCAYYNEYGLPSSWKLQKKDGQLIQAQNENYCYEYTWSN